MDSTLSAFLNLDPSTFPCTWVTWRRFQAKTETCCHKLCAVQSNQIVLTVVECIYAQWHRHYNLVQRCICGTTAWFRRKVQHCVCPLTCGPVFEMIVAELPSVQLHERREAARCGRHVERSERQPHSTHAWWAVTGFITVATNDTESWIFKFFWVVTPFRPVHRSDALSL